MVNIIKQEIDIEEATKHLNNEMDEAQKNFIKQTKRTTTHCSCSLISLLIIFGKNKRTIIIY